MPTLLPIKQRLVVGNGAYAKALARIFCAEFTTPGKPADTEREFDEVFLVIDQTQNGSATVRLQREVFTWPPVAFVSWLIIAPEPAMAVAIATTDLAGMLNGSNTFVAWAECMRVLCRLDPLASIVRELAALRPVYRDSYFNRLREASIVSRLLSVLRDEKPPSEKRDTIVQIIEANPVAWETLCPSQSEFGDAHQYGFALWRWSKTAFASASKDFVSQGVKLLGPLELRH